MRACVAACLKPLEAPAGNRSQQEESLAHITQAEAEAVKEFDAAMARIEEYLRKMAEQKKPTGQRVGHGAPPPPVVKKQRVVKPADVREDDVPGNVRRRERLPRRSAAGA